MGNRIREWPGSPSKGSTPLVIRKHELKHKETALHIWREVRKSGRKTDGAKRPRTREPRPRSPLVGTQGHVSGSGRAGRFTKEWNVPSMKCSHSCPGAFQTEGRTRPREHWDSPVYSGVIHKNPEMETTRVPVDWRWGNSSFCSCHVIRLASGKGSGAATRRSAPYNVVNLKSRMLPARNQTQRCRAHSSLRCVLGKEIRSGGARAGAGDQRLPGTRSLRWNVLCRDCGGGYTAVNICRHSGAACFERPF